ncbi:MAG: acyl--CoA ligase [Candidatus Acidiferrales bacterium]
MTHQNTLVDILNFAPGNRTAVIVPELNKHVTYDSLRQQVAALADALAGAGIRRGDRVAMALPNGLPAIVSFLAASIAGTAAPLNPAYKYDEFCFFLDDTAARVLLCPTEGAEEARSAAADRNIPVFSVGMDSEANVQLQDALKKSSAPPPAPGDIALILHTSGSTGRPKRVPLPHANLAVSAKNIAATYALSPNDVSLCLMPLFHVHGLVASTLATFASGGAVVAPKKFDATAFWRLVREYRVSWYSAVPTIHQLLLARLGNKEKPAGAESLRYIRSCSTALSPDVMHKLETMFGVPVLEAYGMTEAAHQMASNPLPPRPHKAGSVGLATGIRISIMNDSGNHLPVNDRGEVVIQGPNVFHGYENNPEANTKSFSDGWFRTGDQGFLDSDGYLHLTGRLKELINRAGEKIAPREIDEVLLKHPAIAEAVTFGCPHSTLGEEVAAAIVLRQPENTADILKYCREHLAEFKCPKKLYIVQAIPLTATGKIKRSAVAAAILSENA